MTHRLPQLVRTAAWLAAGAMVPGLAAAQQVSPLAMSDILASYTARQDATAPDGTPHGRSVDLQRITGFDWRSDAGSPPMALSQSGVLTDQRWGRLSDLDYSMSAGGNFLQRRASASASQLRFSDDIDSDCSTADGLCLMHPDTGAPMPTQVTPQVLVQGVSSAYDLYTVGGVGAAAFEAPVSFHLHATLRPTEGPAVTVQNARSTAQVSFSVFSGDRERLLASVSAGIEVSYYGEIGASGTWQDLAVWRSWTYRFDPLQDAWTEQLGDWQTVDASALPAQQLTVDETLVAMLPVLPDAPTLFFQMLQTSAGGNASVDADNTATLSGLTLPDGARLYVHSGSDYAGIATLTGGGLPRLCATESCAVTGLPPVPEPQAGVLMLAGLASLGLLMRSRGQRATASRKPDAA